VSALALVIVSLAALVYLHWLPQMVIALRGLAPTRPLPRATTISRFAVLVPAHDEEAVIGALLDSLAAQTYPRAAFDVYVSCDRCTDRTAEIAARMGAQVLTVPEGRPTGKTSNLAYAMTAIDLARYDAVAIFDADNLARPDFLERMNDHLAAFPDTPAVQGYLDVKNPSDSWVTAVYALSFWYVNRFWQLARARWGISAVLGGTGEVVRTSLLREIGSDWQSLTDDLELTCHIVLAGRRVGYEPAAISYDEKPTRVAASLTQRERWLRGHVWALRRFAGPLFARLIATRDLRHLDLLAHLAVPGRASVLFTGMFAGYAVAIAALVLSPALPADHPLEQWWPLFALAATVQCLLVLVVAPSFHRGAPTLRYVPAILPYLLYGIVWIPRLLAIPITRRRRAWIRTEHTRALTLDEVQAAERER